MKLHLALAPLLFCAVAPLAQAQLPSQPGEAPVPSLAPMLKRATPAVVSVQTRGTVQEQNPLFNDPFFRRFFDVPNQPREREFQAAAVGHAPEGGDRRHSRFPLVVAARPYGAAAAQ